PAPAAARRPHRAQRSDRRVSFPPPRRRFLLPRDPAARIGRPGRFVPIRELCTPCPPDRIPAAPARCRAHAEDRCTPAPTGRAVRPPPLSRREAPPFPDGVSYPP